MDKQKQVNNIARRLGSGITQTGLSLIKTAFKINPVEMGYYDFKNLFTSLGGTAPVLLDGKYYLTSWQDWLNIIEVDFTEQHKYIAEKYDCENYSFSFCSRVSWLFGLNSKGAVYGEVFDKNTGKSLNFHYWVAIVTNDTDGRHLYWLETETDKWVKHEIGKPIIIGNMIYKPVNVRFF